MPQVHSSKTSSHGKPLTKSVFIREVWSVRLAGLFITVQLYHNVNFRVWSSPCMRLPSLTTFFKTDISNWINGYRIKSRSGLGTSLPLARLKPDKFIGIVVYIFRNIERKNTNRACQMAFRPQLLRQLLYLLAHFQSFPLSLFVCFLVRILLRYNSLDIFVSKLL